MPVITPAPGYSAGISALEKGGQWQSAVFLLSELSASGCRDVVSYNAPRVGCSTMFSCCGTKSCISLLGSRLLSIGSDIYGGV